jgi:class 3 adenylate cyclase
MGGGPQRAAAPAVAAHAAPPGATAERRLVSILFADLVGFTPFAEERDSEDVRETLTRYFDLATEVIARYGGTVEKFIGDAVMAVWGTPTAREDDAERAVRAALELVDAVRAVGPGISARAGVLTGEAAVTIGATNQGMVAGDLVNTAARLQSVAPPGAVLVGEATHRAASSAIAFEPAGDQLLKGKITPVPAFRALRVVAERGGRGRTEALEAPFVGRDDELRLIKDLYHATEREGRPRLVSVTGIGGIGKSRLAWEFEKYLDGIVGSVWWHRGRSPAYGEGITFWALGEMIRGRAGLAESDDEAATRAAVAAMLLRHVPDEAERRWIEPAIRSLLGVESGIGAQQLFGAWRTFFERLAASGPVVMVFEDLHWADGGTLDFIDHLLEWSRSVPLLIVTLARPELLARRPDWGAGTRSFTSIHLEPLATESMRALLSGLVPGLPDEARDAIVARADGIPLYAVETVRMLLAQGRLVLEDGIHRPVDDLRDVAVPETLTALISARLDELDPADRALVADAAVLGQSFTLPGLAAVSGLDPDDLEPRLRALVRRELLTRAVDPRSPERGQYAFVQALIREVAYNTLAKRDRKARHLAAARFLESLGTDELAGALAGHYLAAHEYATDGREAHALAAQARVALRGAAERAAALGSHAQAITFLEHALTVAPEAGDRADLHERALASALEGLVAEVAERHAVGALEARRELGDREAIALATAAYASALWLFESDQDRILEVVLPAWEEFADLESTAAGVALMLQLSSGYVHRDDATVLMWLERLLPVAERLDLLPQTAWAMWRLGSTLYRLDRPRQALITLRGAHELAVANGLLDVDRNARTSLTYYEQFADPAAGLAMAREGLEIASRRGSMTYGFVMVGNAVSCAVRTGEWTWASSLLDEWLANEITGPFYLELFVDRAVLAALRGADPSDDLTEAEGLVAETKDPQYTSYCHWGRAWEAFTAGRLADARREGVAATDATAHFAPISLPLAGRAMLWSGEAVEARAVADRLDASVFGGQAIDLDRATLRAGIAALEGRRSEAVAGYREVLRGWRQLGLAFDEALATLDLVLLLAPTEHEMAEAAAAVDAARQTLDRLGSRPLLARLEEAAGAGVMP